jgi:Sec-independent protein translocase protein TatA
MVSRFQYYRGEEMSTTDYIICISTAIIPVVLGASVIRLLITDVLKSIRELKERKRMKELEYNERKNT